MNPRVDAQGARATEIHWLGAGRAGQLVLPILTSSCTVRSNAEDGGVQGEQQQSGLSVDQFVIGRSRHRTVLRPSRNGARGGVAVGVGGRICAETRTSQIVSKGRGHGHGNREQGSQTREMEGICNVRRKCFLGQERSSAAHASS